VLFIGMCFAAHIFVRIGAPLLDLGISLKSNKVFYIVQGE